MKTANLIYAASETDANLFYATKFLVGDPVAYVEAGKKKMLVLNDLEIGRGRDEAEVDEVLSLSELTRSIGKGCTMAHVIEKVLRTNGATACTVPPVTRTWRKAILPLERLLSIHPESSTSWPIWRDSSRIEVTGTGSLMGAGLY